MKEVVVGALVYMITSLVVWILLFYLINTTTNLAQLRLLPGSRTALVQASSRHAHHYATGVERNQEGTEYIV